jgi:hypothetical protein
VVDGGAMCAGIVCAKCLASRVSFLPSLVWARRHCRVDGGTGGTFQGELWDDVVIEDTGLMLNCV